MLKFALCKPNRFIFVKTNSANNMTYTVEIQKEYALRILEDLQLMNAIRFQETEADTETDDDTSDEQEEEPEQTKEQLLAKVANALNDVKLYKQGKLKLRPVQEFLDEIRD
jgi:hypothetical protein